MYFAIKTEANAAQGLLFSVSEFHCYTCDRKRLVTEWSTWSPYLYRATKTYQCPNDVWTHELEETLPIPDRVIVVMGIIFYYCLMFYGPGVDSASNRNEYQEYFLQGGGKVAGA